MSIRGTRWLALLGSLSACVGPTLDLGGSRADDSAVAPDGMIVVDAAVVDAVVPHDGSCAGDEDCPLATKSRCHVELGRCVACLGDEDCSGARCEVGEWHCESH